MEQQKVKRSLKYEFKAEEIHELATELANKNQELRQLEENKKAVTADFGSRMTVCKEQIGLLSDRVASGYEMRDVSCVVDYHIPTPNKKTITRTDTNESWEEQMNETDFNLFTQWEEKEKEQERIEAEGSEPGANKEEED